MAGEGSNTKGVFRQSAMSRVASSDELDHYIKVTNPSAWIVTIAALLLVAGVIIWAAVATVPVTVETTGVMVSRSGSDLGAASGPDDALVMCWVDETAADRAKETGLTAIVDGTPAKNAEIHDTPMSLFEVSDFLGSDYYEEKIKLNSWNYLVTIDPEVLPNHTDYTITTPKGAAYLVPVSIVVSETRPINIVLGKKD